MPQYSNGKRVTHKFIGSTQTFSDDTIWEELELGTGLSGTVLARTNASNNTVQLVGNIYSTADGPSNTVLIKVPNTWKFAFSKMPIALYYFTSNEYHIGDHGSIILTKDRYLQSDSSGNMICTPSFPLNNILVLTQGTTGDVSKGYASAQSLFNNVSPATFPITFN
ncbi:hypothetical protein [Lactobacillus acetotolerans]|uniref:hypothetical protein n=1 Tax=Lactobacillus acetotolerans TaxID=1600 RepID=UPI002FD903C1